MLFSRGSLNILVEVMTAKDNYIDAQVEAAWNELVTKDKVIAGYPILSGQFKRRPTGPAGLTGKDAHRIYVELTNWSSPHLYSKHNNHMMLPKQYPYKHQ